MSQAALSMNIETSEFPPFAEGLEVTFLFEQENGMLELVNGPIRHFNNQRVVIDNLNVDGTHTRYIVPRQNIAERFL